MNSQFFSFFLQLNGEPRIIIYDGIGVNQNGYSMKIEVTEEAGNHTRTSEYEVSC